MSAICLVDTSVFVEILGIPLMTATGSTTRKEMLVKIEEGEILLLPFATILETGAHIAQNGDGNQRRACAERFVAKVFQTPENPFTFLGMPTRRHMEIWLRDFPDQACAGRSLADLSIIKAWDEQCYLHPTRRIYIWSLDAHLGSYDRSPVL